VCPGFGNRFEHRGINHVSLVGAVEPHVGDAVAHGDTDPVFHVQLP